MKSTRQFLYILLIALCPLFFTACNESDHDSDEQEKEAFDPFARDGEIKLIQQATKGNGVNIILMGDGFMLQDIEEGQYEVVLNAALDAIFSEQPMKGLRDYFNVYYITTVSLSRNMNGRTALGSVITTESRIVTGYPTSAAMKERIYGYAEKVPNFSPQNSFIAIVMNSNIYGGVCEWTSYFQELAYGFATCQPDGITSDTFVKTLVHEFVGHGIGKLEDEYSTYTTAPTTGNFILRVDSYFHGIHWYGNVTTKKDPAQVPWATFMNDSRYADEEMGVFEGGAQWAQGIYRSTETSIMRSTSNGTGFNAIGRYGIYEHVIHIATDNWPTIDEFITFDQANK